MRSRLSRVRFLMIGLLAIALATPSASYALSATLYAGAGTTTPTTSSLSTITTFPSSLHPVQDDTDGNRAIFLACQGTVVSTMTSATQPIPSQFPGGQCSKSFSLSNGSVTVIIADRGTITCIANCGTASARWKIERAALVANNLSPSLKRLSLIGARITTNFTATPPSSASFRIDAQAVTSADATNTSRVSGDFSRIFPGGSFPGGIGTGSAGTVKFLRTFANGLSRTSPANNRLEVTGHVNGNLVNATSTDGLTTNNADSATGESVGPSVTSAAPPAGAGFFSAPSCTGASLGITTCTASVNFADSEGIGCGNATTACSPTLRKIVAATVNRTGDVLDIPKVDPAYLGVPMSEDSEQDLLQILGQLNYFTYYPKGLGYKVEWNQPSPSISNTFQTGNISFKGNLFLVRNGTIPLVFPLAPPLVFPTPIATGDASFVSVTPAEQLADGSFALVNFERFVTARANFLFDQGDATFGSFRVQFVTPAHIIEACYGTKTSTQNGCSEAAPAAGSTEDLIPSGNDKRWRVDDGNWTSHANVINALSGSDTRVVRARLIVDGGVLVPDQTAGAQVVKLSNWTLEFTKSDATTATLSFSPPPATDPVQLVGNIPQGGILISSPTGQGFRIDPSQVNINNSQFQSGVSAEALLAFFGSGPLQARWTSEEFGLRDAPVDFCVQFPGTNVCP